MRQTNAFFDLNHALWLVTAVVLSFSGGFAGGCGKLTGRPDAVGIGVVVPGGDAGGDSDTGSDAAADAAAAAAAAADAGGLGDAGGETQRVTFFADNTTDFLNPERGWMLRGSDDIFDDARGGNGRHEVGYTVVWSDVGDPPWDGSGGNPFRLDRYRTSDLPSSLLDELERIFAMALREGIKLKIRFAYNYSGGTADTTRERMFTHINQLAPVLTENVDVIASMDAGFIGAWGEMHSSQLSDGEKIEVVNELLAKTPSSLNVGVRYPYIVQGLFNDLGYNMDLAERFTGSARSRVGWYNDCLFANRSNTGTYSRDFSTDRDTFEAVGRFAATSGETCQASNESEYWSCDAVLPDMELIGGPDTLYRDYWQNVYERWIDEGCYDEISRRLGYRLQLVSATLPVEVAPGRVFTVSLEIRNTGFGKVYNPRPFDLIFVDGGGESFTVRLTEDGRRDLPLAGETVGPTWTVNAPTQLQSGRNYSLYLRLPDPATRLEPDNRYTIRLANSGNVWDPATGRHDLGASVLAN